jgi:2-hydroxychromene-2-carboxylate isomerase
MAADIDFYFDFSSPYGYLASKRIDAIAAEFGRGVRWRPILLGAVFKITGQTPLIGQALRGPYHARDLARTARRLGVAFRLPQPFPFASVAAARAFYWLEQSNPRRAIDYAKVVFDTVFGDGLAVVTPAEAAQVGERIGLDGAALTAGMADSVVKERLRREVEAAIERGVFGSPFIFVDGEPFWGNDRLADVAEWLRSGGW